MRITIPDVECPKCKHKFTYDSGWGELGDKVEEEKMTCPRCLKELPKRMFNASIWCDDCYCKVCYDGEKE